MAQRRSRRHRGIQWAGIIVSLAFLGGLVLAILSTRTLRGSIPGTDAILSLATIHQGYLVGRAEGVDESRDGVSWLPAVNIPKEPVQVFSDGVTSFVLAGGTLKSTRDLSSFTTVASGVSGTLVAAGGAGPTQTVYVLTGASVDRVVIDGSRLPSVPAPPVGEPLCMAVVRDGPLSLLVGGVQGLWRTDDAGATWQRILGTPAQGVLVDPDNPERILLGTPGGVLLSTNGGQQWRFTTLRKDVHGLSSENGKFFAVTTERVVYGSDDGDTGWRAVGP